jgi:hypothetical protein
MNRRILSLASTALLALALLAGCSGDDDSQSSTPTPVGTPSPSPTAAPPDAAEAAAVYDAFGAAVNSGDLNAAWALYAASVPGNTAEHLPEQGCNFDAFTVEFPKMQHMFARISPTQTTGTFGDAPNSPTVEFEMTGADGQTFLVTLTRVQPYEPYRVKWMNNGMVLDTDNGTPAPLPSPGDPQGICGIWTGGR